VQKTHRGVSDPDQAYILAELIRYLSDPRSGAVDFDSMGPHWTAVRDGARANTLRKSAPETADVASRWDDLVRYLGLELTKELGRDVKLVLAKEERTPAARQQALRESLASTGRLYADLRVPDSIGPLEIVADLRSRQILVATRIEAPKEGRSRGRVSWLLRQLQSAPGALTVETKAAYTAATLGASLEAARDSPQMLYPEGDKEIRQFILTFTRNMGVKRNADKGSFIDSVISTTTDFYGEVLQHLRAWKAPPPKYTKAPEEEEELALPAPVEAAIEDAKEK